MKHETIKTENYLFIVSDEEIKTDEYYISLETNYSAEPKERYVLYVKCTNLNGKNPKKIIGHLPLNNSPILEGVPLLPELSVEDDVEKLALVCIGGWIENNEDSLIYKGFIEGYKAATKVYSEEDIKKAIELAVDKGRFWLTTPLAKDEYKEDLDNTTKEIIKSLKQPKYPKFFITEIEENLWVQDYAITPNSPLPPMINLGGNLKTTNSQGQNVLVGIYIYE